MYNRKAFKREAKQLMRASTPHFMLVALVYFLLTTGLSYVVTWLTGGSDMLAGTLSVFLNILVGLFSMVMGVGFANYALRLSRKEETGMGTIFDAFSYAGRAIGMNLLVALYSVLWAFLIMIAFAVVVAASALLMDSGPVLGVIVIVIAYIALIVAVVAVVLRYAMAPFALAENPDDGVSEAIRRSVRMMRGYKKKLFVLNLSFIGWELLIALIVLIVMGIGIFVSGTAWMFENLLLTGEDWLEVYSVTENLLGQMTIWTLLAEVVCLPLTLWLTVYMQTAQARFYNFVGGYDYHQYMNVNTPEEEEQSAPVIPLEQPEEVVQEEPVEPVASPVRNPYYTSVVPQEPASVEETEEEAPAEDEEN